MSLTREQVELYFKNQGRPDADEAWFDEFLNAGEKQPIYDEIVQNDYDLSDVDRWFHLMKVMGVDLKFETAMSINSALWEEEIETMELNAPERSIENPLMAFIEQEVPFRVEDVLALDVSEDIVSCLTDKLKETPDIMFNYDRLDQFLLNEYENVKALQQSKMFVFDDELYFGQDEAMKTVDGYLWATDVLVDRMRDAVKDKHTAETVETFDNINFYPIYNCWNCDIKLGGTYYYDDGTGEKMGEFDLTLSKDEENTLINAMEAYCQKCYGKSCAEQLNEFRLEENMIPIPVSEYVFAKKSSLDDKINLAEARQGVSDGSFKNVQEPSL